ncbi:hypothetical protein FNW02_27160 [Komarekiella sp. 'clone 1']|uniref:Uncharacterized protein n=1 Tax=Komarekiella delphini-convector SJRDD-AB1 TaxID=2593771 RepID=A0AA40VTP5_9NOST|nr:hypothetical protein [Komarekiella delphini-convector SJRDD-AB1]
MNLLFRIFQKLINSSLNNLLKLRNTHLLIFDIIVFSITPLLALLLRLDGYFDKAHLPELGIATILFLAVKEPIPLIPAI